MTTSRTLVSWSSGKDSAWALSTLLDEGRDVAGLVTTVSTGRVPMQWSRVELVRRQAELAGLPLLEVELPWPASNDAYAEAFLAAVDGARRDLGVTHVAFGDLWLGDIRAWREELLAGSGVEPLFPIWVGDPDRTAPLAARMVRAGVEATITCVDPAQADPELCGRRWDRVWEELAGDPLGERGELHTFCHAAPCLAAPIPVSVTSIGDRDGFRWADLVEPTD